MGGVRGEGSDGDTIEDGDSSSGEGEVDEDGENDEVVEVVDVVDALESLCVCAWCGCSIKEKCQRKRWSA